MDAFATFVDLGKRLNRVFTSDEQDWVTSLLEDAAEYMRGVIGSQVYPGRQVTYTTYASGGWVDLPQAPVKSVDAVVRDGSPVSYQLIQDSLRVPCDGPVTITFTYGLASPPADLVGINCALVSQMMLTVEAGIGLTAGGLSSVALDDFKAAWADAGAQSGLAMTDATRKYLVDNYGRSAWVVGTSR